MPSSSAFHPRQSSDRSAGIRDWRRPAPDAIGRIPGLAVGASVACAAAKLAKPRIEITAPATLLPIRTGTPSGYDDTRRDDNRVPKNQYFLRAVNLLLISFWLP